MSVENDEAVFDARQEVMRHKRHRNPSCLLQYRSLWYRGDVGEHAPQATSFPTACKTPPCLASPDCVDYSQTLRPRGSGASRNGTEVRGGSFFETGGRSFWCRSDLRRSLHELPHDVQVANCKAWTGTDLTEQLGNIRLTYDGNISLCFFSGEKCGRTPETV